MERWENCVAVVTGASSGIGAAIVKDLINAGVIVVALARRMEKLQEIKASFPIKQQERVYPFKCDLTNEVSINMAFDWIINTLGSVDILINNAAIILPGKLSTLKLSDVRQAIDVNIMGAVICIQRAYKSMKQRDFHGHVIIINSVAGHYIPLIPEADLNIYPPTKFALTAMTEIYRQEFMTLGTKIKITSISPGLTDTNMLSPNIRKHLINKILKPQDVSSAVVYALATPPHVQIHEMIIKPVGERF